MKIAPGVAVVMACLAALTACTTSEPEKPTLASATKSLIADANALLASAEMKESGQVQPTEKAEQDKPGSCLPGEIQRFYRAQGNFLRPGQQSPGVAALSARAALQRIGYDKIIDDLDIRVENLSVVVLRKPESGVTFVVASQIAEPNIVVVGKTDCFKPGA